MFAIADDDCREWLKETGATPGAPSCEIKCASHGVDMGTFNCPLDCEKFCKPKCVAPEFWRNALKNNPSPFKSVPTKEIGRVEKALSRLPKNLKPKSIKAIVVASQPDFLSPQNPASSSNEFIILFPEAFKTETPLERILLHEVVHHLIAGEWVSRFKTFKEVSGWDKAKDNTPRAGDFVEPDGKISADEDFANNIEFYVFESAKLKKASPNIYSWIDKNLSSLLKMEKSCDD